MKEKKHKQLKEVDPRLFLLWVLFPFLVYFVITLIAQYPVVKYGIQADAYVYKKTHARSGKRSYVFTYCQFEYNGLRYTADISNRYKTGENIQILFLPKNPTYVLECDGIIKHCPIFRQRVKKGEIILKE